MEWTNQQPCAPGSPTQNVEQSSVRPMPATPATELCGSGDLVFDVGGHRGDHAEKFLGTGAKVVVFEPQPACVALLEQRFGQDPRVQIVAKGLGAQMGSLNLSICESAPTISTFAEHWKTGRFSDYHWDKTVQVEVTTLDSMIASYGRPKYCKIDVEGFEYQVLRGLSQPIPYVSFECTKEFISQASLCLNHLLMLGYSKFNISQEENNFFCLNDWVSAEQIATFLVGHPDPTFWGDIYAHYDGVSLADSKSQPLVPVNPPTKVSEAKTLLDEFLARGLWQPGRDLRLHLGCGEQLFSGYVNIDYPIDNHAVMKVNPDFTADITKLVFPGGSVSEIRLHHVFEHFTRVTALAMLVKWHEWLRIGGRLNISTPDFEGCAKTFLSPETNWATKMGLIRHLAGDQTASWAFHLDHWFPDRFRHTLTSFGFGSVITQSTMWEKEPWLSNAEVLAVKECEHSRSELIQIADKLLYESLVAVEEQWNHDVWSKQLRELLAD